MSYVPRRNRLISDLRNGILICFLFLLFSLISYGFSPVSINDRTSTKYAVSKQLNLRSQSSENESCKSGDDDVDNNMTQLNSRRKLFISMMAIGSGIVTSYPSTRFGLPSTAANAADVDKTKTIWLTGKDPVIPGKKPRDKNDVTGTRKDPNFLRSVSDCKNQCERSPDKDGYARTKEECFSDCQDVCCSTYQQCTFAIVNRI